MRFTGSMHACAAQKSYGTIWRPSARCQLRYSAHMLTSCTRQPFPTQPTHPLCYLCHAALAAAVGVFIWRRRKAKPEQDAEKAAPGEGPTLGSGCPAGQHRQPGPVSVQTLPSWQLQPSGSGWPAPQLNCELVICTASLGLQGMALYRAAALQRSSTSPGLQAPSVPAPLTRRPATGGHATGSNGV